VGGWIGIFERLLGFELKQIQVLNRVEICLCTIKCRTLNPNKKT
jgi:hypothetical protein